MKMTAIKWALCGCIFSLTYVEGRFNNACFRTTNSTPGTSSVGSSLVTVKSTIKGQVAGVTLELVGVPVSSCALDIYVKGSFFSTSWILSTLSVDCSTSTSGFSEAAITPIKSGREQRMSSYPDVPTDWWEDSGIVVRVYLSEVNASVLGVYECVIRHITVGNVFAVILTIQINGCPYGYWGVDCSNTCQCQNGGTCHPWDGSCRCTEAWKGDICEIPDPHVKVTASNSELFVGDIAILECESYVIHPEEAGYQWFFKGRELEERSGKLTITSITDDDGGVYTCEVTDHTKRASYIDTIQLHVIGCRAGFHGEDCSLLCEYKNNDFCDRFNGCQCSGNYSGPACEHVACNDGVYRKTCEETDDDHDNILDETANRTVLGLGVGVGVTVFIIVAVVLAFYFLYPWQKIAISFRSNADEQCFRSKDVCDLTKDNWNLMSEDLGVLWSQWSIKPSTLFLGKQIGDGHFNWVYEGHVLKGNHIYQVAAKLLKDEKENASWKGFTSELKILADISAHPNVVQLVGVCSKSFLAQSICCLVLEYLPLGSLYKLLHANRKPKECSVLLKPKHYRDIVQGILDGMCRLEELRYIHRDLETRNILLTDKLVAKISDFGLARDSYSTGFYQTEEQVAKTFPWKWMAYESLKDNVYTSKSDVWSFGVLLWEMSTLGGEPYRGVRNEDLLAYLNNDRRLENPYWGSQVWYSVSTDCWLAEPDDRPSFFDLKQRFDDLFCLKQNWSPFDMYTELPDITVTEA